MSTCSALLPISEEHAKRGIQFRFGCENKATIEIHLQQDNINAFGSYSRYFCLDHIPQLTIKKITEI